MARLNSYGARIRSAVVEASRLPDGTRHSPAALQALAERFGVDLQDLTRRTARAVADRADAASASA